MNFTKSQIKQIIREEIKLLIKNPKTGKNIKVSTALTYDETHPAHRAVMSRWKRLTTKQKQTNNNETN
jgi:hypothetical protein